MVQHQRLESASDEVGGGLGDLFDLLQPPAWHRDAACKEAPPEITWFPAHASDCLPAVRVCRGCLAIGACREWALQQGSELKGIWGGLTQRDRQRLRAVSRRTRRKAA